MAKLMFRDDQGFELGRHRGRGGRADGKGKIRGSLWNRMTQRQKPGSECPLGN